METPYRVYHTKSEWDHQARVFIFVGLMLGMMLGGLLVGEIWFLLSFI